MAATYEFIDLTQSPADRKRGRDDGYDGDTQDGSLAYVSALVARSDAKRGRADLAANLNIAGDEVKANNRAMLAHIRRTKNFQLFKLRYPAMQKIADDREIQFFEMLTLGGDFRPLHRVPDRSRQNMFLQARLQFLLKSMEGKGYEVMRDMVRDRCMRLYGVDTQQLARDIKAGLDLPVTKETLECVRHTHTYVNGFMDGWYNLTLEKKF
jgi:hypothetical protein